MSRIAITGRGASLIVDARRPRFSTLWKAYAEVGHKDSESVYQLVGGQVEAHRAEKPANYVNACALRLSRAFNYGGYKIPKGDIVKGIPIYRLRGEDELPYIMTVEGFFEFLKHSWKKPDHEVKPNNLGYINGKQGVLVMLISGWSDATGHATLWDGKTTGDGSDYHRLDSAAYKKPKVKLVVIYFWELKG
ncbi:Type VI secretion system (T6SS), amidase effector protein 4 [Pseudomonas saponiphila]|uniref:Type VI secretion system (T6SS), amidase effector protein 4 n=1 Tax=Pseudomonas saponiphila TaxID=556534 RepID=A0A1H4NVL4_9PSED|nr:T6SS effector amidase Tae4 family protein [Pseudomonas saponiphila]SEB99256.1 Type VI secretion system (T6SS), amidase effector protein 4 [Pseudomonas saponiphila]